jgi:hypothetical protein
MASTIDHGDIRRELNERLLHDVLPSLATGALTSQMTVREEFQKILDDQFQFVSKRMSQPQVVNVWYNSDFSNKHAYDRTRLGMETREKWWTPRVSPGTYRARDSDWAGLFWRAIGFYSGARNRARGQSASQKALPMPSMVYATDPESSHPEGDEANSASGDSSLKRRRYPPPQGATSLSRKELRVKAAQKKEEIDRKRRAREESGRAAESVVIFQNPCPRDPDELFERLNADETQTLEDDFAEAKSVWHSAETQTLEDDFAEAAEDSREVEMASGCCRPLSESVNEVRLWHGTKLVSLLQILRSGFDETLASYGLYGKGIYLASQACKSYQYTESENSGFLWKDFDTFLLYNRVLLGPRPYLVREEDMVRGGALARDWRGWFWNTGPSSVQRRLPRGSDSWIVTPGTRRNGSTQAHEEYVVPRGCQVYPEYVVEVAWPNAGIYAIPGQIAVAGVRCCIGVMLSAVWMFCLVRSK